MNHSFRILKDFKLRSTPSRAAILDAFLNHRYALSHGDLEKEIPASFDRVTVYRTLKTFLDRGLIHKVLDDAGGMKYALCNDACSSAHHHHDHVHFKCTRCGQTNCLQVEIPAIALPKGYQADDVNLLIQGVCVNCG